MRKLIRKSLPDYSFKLLEELMGNKELQNFYLVGGTALALQLGHRVSIDIDLFSQKEFPANLVNTLDGKNYDTLSIHNNSIEIIISSTKVMLFYFAFPLYKKTQLIENIRISHPIDIGLMKLLALQGRSTKKDIIDLYFIDKKVIKLEALLDLFEKHFPKSSFNSYDSLKTLIDVRSFSDEPMPRMFEDIEWENALDLVSGKVTKHIAGLLKSNF